MRLRHPNDSLAMRMQRVDGEVPGGQKERGQKCWWLSGTGPFLTLQGGLLAPNRPPEAQRMRCCTWLLFLGIHGKLLAEKQFVMMPLPPWLQAHYGPKL